MNTQPGRQFIALAGVFSHFLFLGKDCQLPSQDRLRLIGPMETVSARPQLPGRERDHSSFSEALGRRLRHCAGAQRPQSDPWSSECWPDVLWSRGTLVGRAKRAHAAVERASVQRFRVHGMAQVVLEIR